MLQKGSSSQIMEHNKTSPTSELETAKTPLEPPSMPSEDTSSNVGGHEKPETGKDAVKSNIATSSSNEGASSSGVTGGVSTSSDTTTNHTVLKDNEAPESTAKPQTAKAGSTKARPALKQGYGTIAEVIKSNGAEGPVGIADGKKAKGKSVHFEDSNVEGDSDKKGNSSPSTTRVSLPGSQHRPGSWQESTKAGQDKGDTAIRAEFENAKAPVGLSKPARAPRTRRRGRFTASQEGLGKAAEQSPFKAMSPRESLEQSPSRPMSPAKRVTPARNKSEVHGFKLADAAKGSGAEAPQHATPGRPVATVALDSARWTELTAWSNRIKAELEEITADVKELDLMLAYPVYMLRVVDRTVPSVRRDKERAQAAKELKLAEERAMWKACSEYVMSMELTDGGK